MSVETLDELLEKTAELNVRESAMIFLKGERSFRWITTTLSRSGLSREVTEQLLDSLRNYGDSYRSHALFNWLAQTEW